MADPKQTREWVKTIGIAAAIYGVWRFGAKPLLEATGLKSSAQDIAEDKLIKKTESLPFYSDYWSASYLKKFPSGVTQLKLQTFSKALASAKEVWDSKGLINDDEDKLYGVFRNIPYKTQIAQVAEVFYGKYKKDMYSFIKGFLNSSELAALLAITDKKPYGYIRSNGQVY